MAPTRPAPTAPSVLLPFANAFVPDVHLAEGWLQVMPPEIAEPDDGELPHSHLEPGALPPTAGCRCSFARVANSRFIRAVN